MRERIYIGCNCQQCKPRGRGAKPFRKFEIKLGHKKKRRLYKRNLKNLNDEVVNTSLIYTD